MRILMVNKLYAPWIGGVEKIVQQISEGLNGKNNIEIEVLCCQPKGKYREEIINGVKIYKSSSFGIFWGMPISFDFFKLFKKLSKEVDLIDFHHPFLLNNIAFFLFKPKTRVIVHYHSDIVRQKVIGFLFKPLFFYTLKKAEKIIVSNPNLLKSSPYLKNYQEKCEIIPFGVDSNKFNNIESEKSKWIKEKYGKFILFVGRLNYYKGLEYLIKAIKNIDINLVIIGQGPKKKNLEMSIKNLGIENKVYFLPFQEERELINFYKACSVFVLPSIFKSEAFGIALIEAMACGKPIISTELGTGTSWINQDGITGFVVPPRNTEKLTEAISKIITDDNLAKEMSNNALKRAKNEFSLKKMLNQTLIIYNKFNERTT